MNKKRKVFLLALATSGLLIGCDNTDTPEQVDLNTDNISITDTNVKDASTKDEQSNSLDSFLEKHEVDKDNETNNEEVKNNTSNANTNSNKNSSNSTSSNSSDSINISIETNNNSIASNNNDNKNETNNKKEEVTNKEESIVLLDNPTFEKSEITDSIKARMDGKSMKENDSISYDDLAYLTITHLDYNGNSVQGEMVVHKKLADEVLDIFREIYYAKFPIERMRLVDDYNAVDHTSMVNNNSSAFCYRTIANSNKVSNHGMGLAIDINPFYNPHVLKKSNTVNPPEASKYKDRSLSAKGMIKKNDAVYKAFTSRGWTWGGNWNNPDYQHFEKKI